MNDDLIWPSTSRTEDEGSQKSTVHDFEEESIRKHWESQKESLFCEDEDDMLVECGAISEKGGLKTYPRKNGKASKMGGSLMRDELGIETAQFESNEDLEAFIQVSHQF
jgi:hypothetical protein